MDSLNRRSFVLAICMVSVGFTAYGQVPVEQKVQQLQEEWYKKAYELSELGKKIDERNDFIIRIQNGIRALIQKNIGYCSEDEREKYAVAVRNFYTRFLQAMEQIDVKGLFIQEFINNKDEFLNKSDGASKDSSGLVDEIKLALMQLIIERNVLEKLISDYEQCWQKMAGIDRDIKDLGGRSLLVVAI